MLPWQAVRADDLPAAKKNIILLFITLKIDGSTPTLDGMEEVDDHRDDRGEEDVRRLPRRGRGQLPAAAHAVVVVPIPPSSSSCKQHCSLTLLLGGYRKLAANDCVSRCSTCGSGRAR